MDEADAGDSGDAAGDLVLPLCAALLAAAFLVLGGLAAMRDGAPEAAAGGSAVERAAP